VPTLTYASFVFREVEVTPGRWNFLCWEFKWQQYRKWSIWSEGYEVKDMKWRIWSEGYKVKDIKWRVWSEGYEVKDMKWRICNALWPLWSSSSGIYNPTVISRTTSLNIKKLYMVLTLCWSVLYGLLPCATLTDWFCVTEFEIVFCAVRTESLYKTDMFRL